jgi:hypothetical protein
VIYIGLLWMLLGIGKAGSHARTAALYLVLGALSAAVPPLAAQIVDDDSARLIGFAIAVAWAAPLIRRFRGGGASPSPAPTEGHPTG